MDQTKYINSFVDHCVGMIHEQLSSILQLKTHLKIVQDSLAERDQSIALLQQEIEVLKKDLENKADKTAELVQAQNNARSWEESYNAMTVKMSNMDGLASQFNDMKSKYVNAATELEKAKERIRELENVSKVVVATAPKKVINTKEVATTKSTVSAKPKETDDF